MKISRVVPILALFALAPSTAPGFAQNGAEKSWSFSAGVDRSSQYLFRGSDLLDDETVLTPYIVLGLGNFSIYSYGYAGDIPGGDYREIDLGAEYAIPIGSATLTLGAVSYQFNQDAERILVFLDTYEVYGSLGFEGPLSPTVSYWYDNDKVKGGYGTFGIGHSFALGRKASLDFSASVGWDFGYNNKDVTDGTLNDALFGIDVPIQIRENLSIHGSVQRSIALESLDRRREADPSLTGTSEDETVITFGASLTF